MTPDLALKLKTLADKYEVSSFCNEDPSQFLRWYTLEKDGVENVECACFIAAMLAFGSRKQFIPKIRTILQLADQKSGGIAKWCLSGAPDFPCGSKKFYRFYSYDDMHSLFEDYAAILKKSGSLGEYLRTQTGNLAENLSAAFPNAAIVPKGKNSANKRIHMFLRWMVRQNSAVDLGLWTWASPAELLIPLDVHVMQEAIGLGLLPQNAGATRRTAQLLTSQMEQVFPGDPSRGDFALFGLGVDKNQSEE